MASKTGKKKIGQMLIYEGKKEGRKERKGRGGEDIDSWDGIRLRTRERGIRKYFDAQNGSAAFKSFK